MSIEPTLVFGIIFALLGFLCMLSILIILFSQAIKASKVDALKAGMIFRAGGKIGKYNITFPFIKVNISEKRIDIEYTGRNISLLKRSNYAIELLDGLFSQGVRIKSGIDDIILWSPYAPLIMKFLNESQSHV